jgi:hypothetical protein
MNENDDSLQLIAAAVARETLRRKKVFTAFLLLLLLPLGAAAYALSSAPTRTEAFTKAVEPGVTQLAMESIGPRMNQVIVSNSGPIIRDQVARQYSEVVAPQLSTLSDDLRGVDADNRRVDARLTSLTAVVGDAQDELRSVVDLRPQLAQLPALIETSRVTSSEARLTTERVTALSAAQGVAGRRLDEIGQASQTTQHDVEELTKRVVSLEQQIAQLQREMKRMQEDTRWRIYHRPAPKTP